MQRNDLQKLINKMLTTGYEGNAYDEYRLLTDREIFSQENYHDMLSLTKPELKKPDLKHKALLWDLYLYAREGIKPYDASNIISIKTGMLYKSRFAFNLRALYFWHGVKSDVDYKQTYQLFRKAAALGYVNASFNCGILHERGLGRDKNDGKARYYYELAAQQQFPFAYSALARLVLNGRGGFKQDLQQACEFFKTAVELGDKAAIDEIYFLALEMFPNLHQGIDCEKAIPIFAFIADLDHPLGLTRLAVIFYVQKKYTLAKCLFERAIKFNVDIALINLAIMYRDGLGVQKNLSHAMHYLKRALKAGSDLACFNIANLYLMPEFGYNATKVIKYLEKGVANDEINCILRLALYYHRGEHSLEKNIAKCVALNQRGAELSSADCHYNLAVLYFKYRIDTFTEAEAHEHLDYVIAAGMPEAYYLRAEIYASTNDCDHAAKFYRKELSCYHDDERYKKAKQRFAQMARKGSVIQEYHWYMSEVTETLSQDILNLYQRRPWTIIQEILNDDIVNRERQINYLSQLPGTFLTHISAISISHPIRVQLNKTYEYFAWDLITDFKAGKIDETAFLDKLTEPAIVASNAPLPVHLSLTTLFHAILNNWINELEIPRALARIYQCHKTIIRLDYNDIQHQPYMSVDGYLHILSAHLQLIEAYVNILRQEVAKISKHLSRKQNYALGDNHALLALTDALLYPSRHRHHDKLTNLHDHIKSINTPALWVSVKQSAQNTSQQLQLSMRFFHAVQAKYASSKQLIVPRLARIFNP